MKTPHKFAIGLTIAAPVLANCIGGLTYDSDTRQPINGVTVAAKPCPACSVSTTVTSRQSPDGSSTMNDGMFKFDPYSGGPPVLPDQDALATEYTFSKPGYRTVTYYHRPQLQLYEHKNPNEQRLGDYFIVYMSQGADTDGDQLPDSYETWAQLDPNDNDTDDDGLPDGWEVLGHDFVDYSFYGADPRHKDLFVELDYESYMENSVQHSAALRAPVIAKIEAWYDALNVTNPDGIKGVNVHLVHDSTLPKGFSCSQNGSATLEHPRLKQVFHYGQLCITPPTANCNQQGVASGEDFFVRAKEVNADSGDDQTEEQMFLWAMMTAHEIGHTFGLRHGGGDTLLCKPNYPSLMNYPYARFFNGSPQTLGGTQLQFSPGRFVNVTLNEASMNERTAFAAFARSDIEFMRRYGFPLDAHGFNLNATQPWVDFDRDGVFDTANVAVNLTARGYTTTCSGEVCAQYDQGPSDLLRDYNDGELVANYLRNHPAGASFAKTVSASEVCQF